MTRRMLMTFGVGVLVLSAVATARVWALAAGPDDLPRDSITLVDLTDDDTAAQALTNKFLVENPGSGQLLTEDVHPWGSALTFLVQDPSDETLGATFQTVPDAVRTQLKIPKGRGILVADIAPDGPAAQAGVRRLDILLTLADHPIAAAGDIEKHLKAAGEKPVALTLLRSGKLTTLQVRPVYRVTFGPVESESTEYILGVMLGAIDDALRSQLALADKPGVIVNELVSGSPADKAGVRAHDILLKYNGTSLANQADLARLVNEGKGKTGALVLLREGKEVTLDVTPERRTVKAASGAQNIYRYYSVNPYNGTLFSPPARGQTYRTPMVAPPNLTDPNTTAFNRAFQVSSALARRAAAKDATKAGPDARLDALQKEIQTLQQTVQKLRADLEAERGKAKNPD